jgi:hypothetical protein
MQSTNGYKYTNEADALHAQGICRINEGLPKPGGTTLQAVDVQFASLNVTSILVYYLLRRKSNTWHS